MNINEAIEQMQYRGRTNQIRMIMSQYEYTTKREFLKAIVGFIVQLYGSDQIFQKEMILVWQVIELIDEGKTQEEITNILLEQFGGEE